MNKLKIGDPVKVMDPGLLMMQQFAPKGSFPNNYGWVESFCDDDTIMVLFPIGKEDIKKHSQVAPYPKYLVQAREGEPIIIDTH